MKLRKATVVETRKTATSEPVFLELPWPPSENSLRRPFPFQTRGKRGAGSVKRCVCGRRWSARMILAKEARIYYRRVTAELKPLGIKRFTDPVRVEYRFHPPDRRIRDAGNYFKVLEDALVKARILEDDSLIRACGGWSWEPPVRPGRVEVLLRRLEA